MRESVGAMFPDWRNSQSLIYYWSNLTAYRYTVDIFTTPRLIIEHSSIIKQHDQLKLQQLYTNVTNAYKYHSLLHFKSHNYRFYMLFGDAMSFYSYRSHLYC